MSYEWANQTVPVSAQLAEEASAFRRVLDAEMDLLQCELREYWLDVEIGPRLGPGRSEWEKITAPARRRARLRAHVVSVMPGKRPGRFVR